MTSMTLRVFLAVPLVSVAGLMPADVSAEDPELKSIFNGKDLSGWKVPDGNKWWKVDDGVLTAQNDDEKKGSTLWTKGSFRDFDMELEFKFGSGTVDTGVYIKDHREQIQIGISGSLKRDMTASPYISGKGYPVEAEGVAELLKPDGWNAMRIEVRGKTYTVYLNEKKVMTYTSDTALDEGPVGLQLHGNREMVVHFRNLRLSEVG